MTDADANYDIVVVGGGPAGLTAAIYLARFRRRVLVVDEGKSRAASIPWSHNYPGFSQGVSGKALVAAMREQASRYGAVFQHGVANQLQQSKHGFDTWWEGGHATSRAVLLATGVSVIAPEMSHLTKALNDGHLRFCPVCDGFECAGKRVGVIANSPNGVSEALYLQHFTDCITLFVTNTDFRIEEQQRSALEAVGIAVEPRVVENIQLVDGCIHVQHGDGVSECDAVYAALGLRVHSELAIPLSVKLDADGYLEVDAHYQTSVEGLFCAGDVAQGLNQITVAAGSAAIAASAVHLHLHKQDRIAG